jgi:ABC-2 type transport system permease protein
LAFVLLGGAYYPLSVLPPGLRELGRVIPFTWALDLVRGCLVSGQAPLARLVELVAIDAVLLPLAIWTLGKAIDHTRRTGTLGQY